MERFDDILKPLKDRRSYRGLKLRNNMKILLIHDPLPDKSAVAMVVGVGNFISIISSLQMFSINQWPQTLNEEKNYCKTITSPNETQVVRWSFVTGYIKRTHLIGIELNTWGQIRQNYLSFNKPKIKSQHEKCPWIIFLAGNLKELKFSKLLKNSLKKNYK